MSTDLAVMVCFGVDFGDGHVLPWVEQGMDLESWWLTHLGAEGPPEESYAGGSTVWSDYYKYRRSFLEKHPMPILETNYGYDGESIVIAVPGTCKTSFHYVITFDKGDLKVGPEDLDNFLWFFRRNSIELPSQPSWLALAYYG